MSLFHQISGKIRASGNPIRTQHFTHTFPYIADVVLAEPFGDHFCSFMAVVVLQSGERLNGGGLRVNMKPNDMQGHAIPGTGQLNAVDQFDTATCSCGLSLFQPVDCIMIGESYSLQTLLPGT